MTVVGAVLAGGQSRRMGRDKAALVLDESTGETFGARAVRVLREVASEVVVLGHGRGLDEALPRLEDAVAGAGPVAGLLALLESGRASRYVVMPVDMPLVDGAALRALLGALDGPPEALAALYTVAGAREPLPLAVRAGAGATVARAVAAGERRLGAVLDELHPRLIAGDQTSLRNINTFGEFETIAGAHRHR